MPLICKLKAITEMDWPIKIEGAIREILDKAGKFDWSSINEKIEES